MTTKRTTNGGGLQALKDKLEALNKGKVQIGVTKDTNARPDGGSNALIGMTHEFGANIKHGGGTRYQNNANGNLAKFVPNSFIGPTSGVTKAHIINIPERPHLRTSIIENSGKYLTLLKENLMNENIYQIIGNQASNDVKLKIRQGGFEPLKRSTIKRKGSSKPLVDTGAYIQSITYKVEI